MTNDTACLNCAFYNPKSKYECDMTSDIPVVCSVKMKKNETRETRE